MLFFLLPVISARAQQGGFNKEAYYQVMENASVETVDKQLKIIETSSGINKDAYRGALLMKKAGVIKGASKKLNTFKSGHKQLEAAIEKENENGEWRFLRLMIQENAPKILGYRSDIDKDATYIHSAFKKLSPEVQSAVMSYRKQSNSLKKLNF